MVAKKLYPREQDVVCAFCGKPAVRMVMKQEQKRNKHYCNDVCKKKRRDAIRAGVVFDDDTIEPVRELKEGAWSNLGLGPRRNINEIVQPTEYEARL